MLDNPIIYTEKIELPKDKWKVLPSGYSPKNQKNNDNKKPAFYATTDASLSDVLYIKERNSYNQYRPFSSQKLSILTFKNVFFYNEMSFIDYVPETPVKIPNFAKKY